MDQIHYLHFGLLLWFISGLVAVVVSLMTPPPPEDSLHRLTFWSRHSKKVRVEMTGEEVEKPAVEQPKTKPIRSELPYWRVCFNFMCGVEMDDGTETVREAPPPPVEKTPEEKAEEAAGFLYEPSCKKWSVNFVCLTLISVAIFFWVFYA